ncbi:MAG TPA: diaminopimelate decarboxylase [bacterium]|nr:diaminopimelate decarboxylase [bacterium]HOL48118.1 diaminopimelate decarboxylase [bacterium]HPQ19723.1 diaminopimelate decarboxylase [bacterium]
MDFVYKKNILYCEKISCADLIKKYGTPLYVYSYEHIKKQFLSLYNSLKGIKNIICFSVKSCSNIAIINSLVKLGAGCDIVSGGELYRALKAGCSSEKIVYAGVGKTAEEIKYAIKSNILMFNVESFPEAELINSIASSMNKKVKIALRVNPDVEAKTHKHITTGTKKNKFGINYDKIIEVIKYIKNDLTNIEFVGLHFHIGSQITDINPFKNVIIKIRNLLNELKKNDINIRYLNMGGGLGIKYNNEKTINPKEYSKLWKDFIKSYNSELTLIIEPGRFIVGNSAVLLTKVTYVKETDEKNFIIVDAGMNDLIRPAFYDAYHQILPIVKNKNKKEIKVDIVGPICESGDYFAKERMIEVVKQNDYLAIFSAGAYGFAMSSNYNSRPRSAEILVKGDKDYLIRKRENYIDLIKNEKIIK